MSASVVVGAVAEGAIAEGHDVFTEKHRSIVDPAEALVGFGDLLAKVSVVTDMRDDAWVQRQTAGDVP